MAIENTLISYEEAEAIVEQNRPDALKKIDAADPEGRRDLKEAIFSAVCIRLLAEGNILPVSRAYADTGEELKPLIMKTQYEWEQYIHYATLSALRHEQI